MMTYRKLCAIIGGNLKNQRKKYDLTITELADLIGVTQGYIAYIEHGNRGITANTLYILSNFFNISMNDFLKTDSRSILIAEEKSNPRKTKISRIYMMASKLSEPELDFLIARLESLKHFIESKSDFDEDDGFL